MFKRLGAALLTLMFLLPFFPTFTVVATSDNLLQNSGFETLHTNGLMPIGWYEYWGANQWIKVGARVAIDTETKYNGDNSVKLSPTSTVNTYVTQTVSGFQPGAYYQINAKLRGAGRLSFKIEYSENGVETWRAYTENSAAASGTETDTWVDFTTQPFAIGDGVTTARFYAIVSVGELNIDDLSIVKVRDPDHFAFATDNIFYYTEETGDGTASTTASSYYDDYADTRTVFSLSEGTQVLRTSTVYGQGSATFRFPLSLLAIKQSPYTVTASMYKGDTLLQTESENVYKFDRPTKLNSTNNFIVNGKIFHPIIMMGVGSNPATLLELKEAGVNTVFCGVGMLDACEANGMKGIVFLYSNMLPAGHPNNIESTRQTIARYKNHPALLGWSVMDEPFGNSDKESMKKWIVDSYTTIRSIDPATPIVIVEGALMPSYVQSAAKYCDVVSPDPYPGGMHSPTQYIARFTHYAQEAARRKKPVFTTLQTFLWGGNYFPNSDDFRSGVYQSFFEGAQGLAYYCFKNSYNTTPLNETPLWQGLVDFYEQESALLFEHFVDRATVPFNDYRGLHDVWYHSFVKDGKVYLMVLNRNAAQKSVNIPMVDYSGTVQLNDYTARVIIGTDADNTRTSGNILHVNLTKNCAILYELTPNTPIDFSSLSWTGFEAVTDYNAPYAPQPEKENLFLNGSMELKNGIMPQDWASDTVLTGGTASRTDENASDGDYSVALTKGGGIRQSVYLEPGTYVLSYRYKGARPTISCAGSAWETPEAASMARVCKPSATEATEVAYTPWGEQRKVFSVSVGNTYDFRFTHQDGWGENIPVWLDEITLLPYTAPQMRLYNRYTSTWSSDEPIDTYTEMTVSPSKILTAALSYVAKADLVASRTGEKSLLMAAQYSDDELLAISTTTATAASSGEPLALTAPFVLHPQSKIIKLFLWDGKSIAPHLETIKLEEA